MYEYKGKPDVSETNRTFAELIDTSEIADKQKAFDEEMRRKYYDVVLYSVSKAIEKSKASYNEAIRIPIDKNLIEDDIDRAIKYIKDGIFKLYPTIESVEFLKDYMGQSLTCVIQIDKSITTKSLADILTEKCFDDTKVKIFVQDENGKFKSHSVVLVFKGLDTFTQTHNLYIATKSSNDIVDNISWPSGDVNGVKLLECYYSE